MASAKIHLLENKTHTLYANVHANEANIVSKRNFISGLTLILLTLQFSLPERQ